MKLILILTISLFSSSFLEAQNFKRFNLELNDGTIIKGKNATIFVDSVNYNYFKLKNNEIPLSQIRSLSYSNTHSGGKGSAWGSVVGLVVPVYLAIIVINDSKKNSNSEMSISSVPYILLAGVVTVGTGAGVGYLVGSRFYTDWQDYPLRNGSRYKSSQKWYSSLVFFDPNSTTFRIQWNFSVN